MDLSDIPVDYPKKLLPEWISEMTYPTHELMCAFIDGLIYVDDEDVSTSDIFQRAVPGKPGAFEFVVRIGVGQYDEDEIPCCLPAERRAAAKALGVPVDEMSYGAIDEALTAYHSCSIKDLSGRLQRSTKQAQLEGGNVDLENEQELIKICLAIKRWQARRQKRSKHA